MAGLGKRKTYGIDRMKTIIHSAGRPPLMRKLAIRASSLLL